MASIANCNAARIIVLLAKVLNAAATTLIPAASLINPFCNKLILGTPSANATPLANKALLSSCILLYVSPASIVASPSPCLNSSTAFLAFSACSSDKSPNTNNSSICFNSGSTSPNFKAASSTPLGIFSKSELILIKLQ